MRNWIVISLLLKTRTATPGIPKGGTRHRQGQDGTVTLVLMDH